MSDQSIDEAMTHDALYLSLRERILIAELAPGATISQVRLAGELGVNRTPLREALRMLQRDGLIEANFNRRVRVSPLTTMELESLYAERILTEAFGAAVTVPRMGDEQIDALGDAVRKMHALATGWQLDEWEVANRAFHSRLVRLAGAQLTARIADLSDLSRRYRRALVTDGSRGTEGMAQGEADHEAILEASRKRDGELAGKLLARHLARTALGLIAIRDPAHDPVAIRDAQVLVGTPAASLRPD